MYKHLVSKMLSFSILISTLIVSVHCIEVKVGADTEDGHWNSTQEVSLPLTVGGATYIFSLSGHSWFIKELRKGGRMGADADKGTFQYYYPKIFQFHINGRQFLYGISDRNYWFIQEILPGGKMGKETDNGNWPSTPTIIFPLNVNGNHFIFSLSDNNWLIKKITPYGRMGSQVDQGSWKFKYNLGFPYSINGKQYIYCLSEKYWFIQKINEDGTMGLETSNGRWLGEHKLYFPFNLNGKQYFFGLTSRGRNFWFIQELLAGGKMGPEKTSGVWRFYYSSMFAFKIDGKQYVYGVSEKYWFILQILQEPKLPVVIDDREYCDISNTQIKRQSNYVDEYLAEIRESDEYDTLYVDDPDHSVLWYCIATAIPRYPGQPAMNLTMGIEAEIHPRHVGNGRQQISSEVYQHLENMDRELNDEASQLVADSLGGPTMPYNFVPQSPMLNRRVHVTGSLVPQPGWYNIEEAVRQFITATGGYVRWTVAVIYDNLQNSRRPTAFWLSVRLFDAQGQPTNWEQQSSHTTYVFDNVPTLACTSMSHSWWNTSN